MSCPVCGSHEVIVAAIHGRLFTDYECECGARWRADRWLRVHRVFNAEVCPGNGGEAA